MDTAKEGKQSYDVFVSFAGEDLDSARAIARHLADAGFSVWFEEFRLGIGEVIDDKIEAALAASRVLLFVLSSTSQQKAYPLMELGTHLLQIRGAERVLPVRIDNGIPPFLKNIRCASFESASPEELAHIEAALRKKLDNRGETGSASPRADRNTNFLVTTTFLFGACGGLAFLIFYVLELLLLVLNPVNVHGMTGYRYLLYHYFTPGRPTLASQVGTLDVIFWATDFKKLTTYAILAFWMGLFSRILAKAFFSRMWLFPSGPQRSAASWFLHDVYVLPFWANALIAAALTCLFSPAAMNPFRISGDGNTSIYQAFLATEGFMRHPFFVLYRIASPTLVWLCLCHLLIAMQALFQHMRQRQSDPFVRRLAWTAAAFFLSLYIVEQVVQSFLDGAGQALRDAVAASFIIAGVVIVAAILILFSFKTDAAFPIPPYHLRPRSLLMLFVVPLLFFAVPPVIAFGDLRIRLKGVEAPSKGGTGYRAWLDDPALKGYLVDLDTEVRSLRDSQRFKVSEWVEKDAALLSERGPEVTQGERVHEMLGRRLATEKPTVE